MATQIERYLAPDKIEPGTMISFVALQNVMW